jgi:hypothetical protein
MTRKSALLSALALLLAAAPAAAQSAKMNFFLASEGATPSTLEEADRHCYTLAYRVGAGDLTWRAFLSAGEGAQAVRAVDRVGAGPWFNYRGAPVAQGLADLQAEGDRLSSETVLTERGQRGEGNGSGAGGPLAARLERLREGDGRFYCFAID